MQKSAQMIHPRVSATVLLACFLMSCTVAPQRQPLRSVAANDAKRQFDFREFKSPVVTFRLTGEDVTDTEVTLYQLASHDEVQAEVRLGGASNAPRVVSSRDVPELRRALVSLAEIRISPVGDDTLYMPSMTVEVWVSGIASEMYARITLPSESADSAAYWGDRGSRSAAIVEWVRTVSRILSLTYAKRS